MKQKLLFLILLFATFLAQARPDLLTNLGLDDDIGVPPSVDEAFVFSAEVKDEQTLQLQWAIAEGNYLYRDKINISLLNTDGSQLLTYSLPPSENKLDEVFGPTQVYTQDIALALKIKAIQSQQPVKLEVGYQGCSETFHICYPPVSKTVSLILTNSNTNPHSIDSDSQPAETAANPIVQSEQDALTQRLMDDNLVSILLTFLGLGILLAFTPCVFPMIPILSSIIVGHGNKITTQRAFLLSLSYVLAMSVTYTFAGIIAGLLGENLQAQFQSPWILASFSALFVILSLSMFGLFELQLPSFLQNKVHQISQKQQGGSLMGAAAMGFLSSLIVGPCLAPPLASALAFIGQQGDPILGGAALFSLSLGMGIPLLIIGTSAGKLLPKAGGWMNTIKAIFGVLMLGVAIWMLERILPGWVSLILWASLLIISSAYLGAFNTISDISSGWGKLWKGIGIIFLLQGALLMIGAATGSHNVWQPLSHLSTGNVVQSTAATPQQLHFNRINNIEELHRVLAETKQPVMLDFYADWCVECKKMEETTFKDQQLIQVLNGTTLLQLDMTDNNQQHKAMLKQLAVFAPPTILFFNAQGEEEKALRLVGMVNSAKLAAVLAQRTAIDK